MIARVKHLFWVVLIVLALSAWALQAARPLDGSAQAAAGLAQTTGTVRQAQIKISTTTYEWWLAYWKDSSVACQVYIEHEGLPDSEEVRYYCGDTILAQWLATKPCTLGGAITTIRQCPGMYLHLNAVTPGERTISVKLSPATAWLSIAGCELKPPHNRCDSLPYLRITGEEPLPNEQIIRVQGTVNGQAFSCAGGACDIPLPPTGRNGVPVEFWVDSSFGDSSEKFTALVRAVPQGDFLSPDEAASSSERPFWYVDVISSQWRGEGASTCSQIWSSFPELGGAPAWLTTPDQPEALRSTAQYYYLAGALIQKGAVDASACPAGGLQSENMANECGLQKAAPQVEAWQNQFDGEILRVAKDTGVPGQLMKNVFSRESQFWPGYFQTLNEAGLGQLTDNGADTVLLWNPAFYSQFCPLVFKNATCQQGFGNLTAAQQATLRGAMVSKVNAACPDCPTGIDLEQANFSISVFARSLLANCEQVGQMVYNDTGKVAGEIVSYSDLWRFTLVNYNAGPGCLSNAMEALMRDGAPLVWSTVVSYLEPVCQSAVGYVEQVSFVPGAPQATATAYVPTPIYMTPAATRFVTATPTVAGRTVTPGVQPTRTLQPTRATGPAPTATVTGAYPPPNEATPTFAGYPIATPTMYGYP